MSKKETPIWDYILGGILGTVIAGIALVTAVVINTK